MIIVNKENNDAYNLSHITNFYIGSDCCSVKVSAGNATRGGILGTYNSHDETKKAFEILMGKIQNNDAPVIYMPSDNDVSDKLRKKQAYHHVTGKKTKGHGGS